MKDGYRGRLSQRERWDVWEQSLNRPMGSYASMREEAEHEKFKKTFGYR